MEKELILVKNVLNSLNKRSREDVLRFEMFSILTTILLSDYYFKKNHEIEDFLQKSGIEFRPYVFKSRTLVVARVNRIVEKSNTEELLILLGQCKELVFDNSTIYQKKNKNDIDDIMDQFRRK